MKLLIRFLLISCLCVGPLFADQPKFYEQVYSTLDTALDTVFKKGTTVTEVTFTINPDVKQRIEQRLGWEVNETDFTIYKGEKNNQSTGYAIVLDELGKYYPITFLTHITPDFKVSDIVLMVYREKIGASVRKKRFLNQFKWKTSKDPLMVDNDIMGISGATMSSWAISAGVKKALIITEILSHTL